jgi:hypothetical protein
MWRFDQGRIEYFQFDELRKLAKFAVENDLKSAKRADLVQATGLPFLPADENYPPWRNYSRVFRTAMIVAEVNQVAVPTKVAHLLAEDGKTNSDEYFHFLVQSFTDPSPSFQQWDFSKNPRFPLLFSLKYLIAKSVLGHFTVPYSEIVAAYKASDFDGDEGQTDFLAIANKTYSSVESRQARESIQVISQISYLSAGSTEVSISLDSGAAIEVFEGLSAIRGDRKNNRDQEIIRLTNQFESAVAGVDLDYLNMAVDHVIEAGFAEGNRVERTHVVLERNAGVRAAFFLQHPTTACDFCERDTALEFPWVERVLDIHHLLPLCSGTRSSGKGTDLSDLVALCPTCHKAVHRFYAGWLSAMGRKDFADVKEARSVYQEAKKLRKPI